MSDLIRARSSFLAAWVLVVATAAPGLAQTPPGPPFVFESEGGANRLQLGALVQFDGRFTIDDPRQDVVDTFVMRRVRPVVQGRVARYFDYFVVLDFANSSQYVRDAYFDTRFSNAFRVRVGKGKVPFGLERLHFANVLLFVERALPSSLTPDRDVGVQVLGDLAGGRLTYAAAVTNGAIDGGSTDVDADEGKDVAARVIVSPWGPTTQHSLAGAGFGFAVTSGHAAAALPSFRTSGQATFFSYAGATGDGRRTRISPQAFYYRGPLGIFTEYVRSRGGIQSGRISAEIDDTAWQLAGSWVLTGERATDRGVRPRANFDPERGTVGAVQLAVRYHELGVDRDVFALGFAAPGASRTARAFTVGANWYATPFIKWVFNVERTVFDSSEQGRRPAENAVLVRGQLSF
ncbi:MAG: porin [Acidobacteria bacterium]|nr:porin [Acidobacteriota bacterium]